MGSRKQSSQRHWKRFVAASRRCWWAAREKARTDAPQNADAWLLSATLSRRLDDLAAAQGQIETAAALAPEDPAVGLEAGVIAALAGNDEAARKSWNSVLGLAPDAPEAAIARTYLGQLAEGSE